MSKRMTERKTVPHKNPEEQPSPQYHASITQKATAPRVRTVDSPTRDNLKRTTTEVQSMLKITVKPEGTTEHTGAEAETMIGQTVIEADLT